MRTIAPIPIVCAAALVAFAALPARALAAADPSAYLEIPLRGVFGEDIVFEGVQKTFDYAKQTGVKHIVFTLDSPGGYVATAQQILDLMKANDDVFDYHVVVTRAISASIWVVFACDDIFVKDGATVGGAVAYTTTLGNAQVDAKMCSIIAAEIRAAAEKKGHPAALIEPMVVKDAKVAAWKDEEGKVRFALEAPKNVPPEKVILVDTSETVLTLSANQALEVGLGRRLEGRGGADDLGKALGIEGWKRLSDCGERNMADAAKAQKKKLDDVKKTSDKMKSLSGLVTQSLNEAAESDPGRGTYAVERGGKLTPASRQEWATRTDRSVRALKSALEKINDWQSQQAKLKKLLKTLGVDLPTDDANVEALEGRVRRDIATLQANRNRVTM